jgi:hypothetical protein
MDTDQQEDPAATGEEPENREGELSHRPDSSSEHADANDDTLLR